MTTSSIRRRARAALAAWLDHPGDPHPDDIAAHTESLICALLIKAHTHGFDPARTAAVALRSALAATDGLAPEEISIIILHPEGDPNHSTPAQPGVDTPPATTTAKDRL